MPPARLRQNTNVTTRQFAEISDASISFQIPTGSSNDEFLLDSDPGEFLEDVAPTPGPSRLRLAFPMSESPGEATPKCSRQISVSVPPREPQVGLVTSLVSEPTSFVIPQEAAPNDLSPEDATPRPTLRLTTGKAPGKFPEASPVKDRLDAIQSSLNELGPEAPAPEPRTATRTMEGLAKPVKTKANDKRPSRPLKSSTISGGITKRATSSSKPLRSTRPRSQGSKSSNETAQPFDMTPPFASTPRVTAFAPSSPPRISAIEPAQAAQPQSLASSNPHIENAVPDLFSAQDEPSSSIIANVSPKHNNPLTVSQLSPSKQASTHRKPASESPPASHRRSSGKRPFSVAASDEPDPQLYSQKRTKVSSTKPAAPQAAGANPDDARHHLGASLKPDSRTALRQTRAVARGRVVTESQLDRGKSLRKIPSTNTKTRKLFSSGGVSRSQRPEPERLSSSDGNLRSRPTRSIRADTKITAAHRSNTDKGKDSLIAQSAKSKTKAGSVAEDDKENKRVAFPLLNATKPVEFTFRSDARVEARKSESENGVEGSLTASKRRGVPSQIPDYKTLHAQDEARRSQRRAPVAPTVPHPFSLHTENRVRERQVFDEHIREKEREMELVMEQKRREKEEEEEREIRELRKKAIPKAHVVPEWYKDAPKRTNKAREVGVAGSSAGPVA